MNNSAIAEETKVIIGDRSYQIDGVTIELPDFDFTKVKVIPPEKGEELLNNSREEKNIADTKNITITAEDAFKVARRFDKPLVMNFANAHRPGGGSDLESNGQEESLCRCSTLIASLGSYKAKEMYNYNNMRISSVESDYMLLSRVCVFRKITGELLFEPYITGVISMPAPNKIGMAALTPRKKIEDTLKRRIRIMCLAAKEEGYKSLVLGAWGCGAFHNDPELVSECFRSVLVDEGYGADFENICFAIYGREDGKKITAFRACFNK